MGLTLFKGARRKDDSKWTQAGTWEILTHYKKKLFDHEGDQILKKAVQGGCWISTIGVAQNSAGHSPKQLDRVEPALNRRLDGMNENGSFQLMIPWLYNSVYLQLEILPE